MCNFSGPTLPHLYYEIPLVSTSKGLIFAGGTGVKIVKLQCTVGISRIKFSSFWHRISKILKNCIFHWNRIYDAMQAFTNILVSILGSILPDFARFRPILPYILWFYWFFKILLCNIDLITISDRLFFNLMSDLVRFWSDFCPILSNFDQLLMLFVQIFIFNKEEYFSLVSLKQMINSE